jgi:hypothetical protein
MKVLIYERINNLQFDDTAMEKKNKLIWREDGYLAPLFPRFHHFADGPSEPTPDLVNFILSGEDLSQICLPLTFTLFCKLSIYIYSIASSLQIPYLLAETIPFEQSQVGTRRSHKT